MKADRVARRAPRFCASPEALTRVETTRGWANQICHRKQGLICLGVIEDPDSAQRYDDRQKKEQQQQAAILCCSIGADGENLWHLPNLIEECECTTLDFTFSFAPIRIRELFTIGRDLPEKTSSGTRIDTIEISFVDVEIKNDYWCAQGSEGSREPRRRNPGWR